MRSNFLCWLDGKIIYLLSVFGEIINIDFQNGSIIYSFVEIRRDFAHWILGYILTACLPANMDCISQVLLDVLFDLELIDFLEGRL